MILAEGHVADVEHTVLNSPVLPGQMEERFGVGAIRRKGRDPIPRFGGGLPAPRSLAHQLEGLGQVRPVDVVAQGGAARQGSCFETTMSLADGHSGLTFGGDELSLPGGKHRPWRTHR
jgi:hypothetical protein